MENKKNRKPKHKLCLCLPMLVLVAVIIPSWFALFSVSSTTTTLRPTNTSANIHIHSQLGPYHNWQQSATDFEEMMRNFKIYVYPHVYNNNVSEEAFAGIFLPHPNPFNPRLGKYLSEHMFKLSLLRSSLITSSPQHAHFFFLPFSINTMRNDPRIHSESSIVEFVAQYTARSSNQFPFWNASAGADHFYVCCHSVGRDAASKRPDLLNDAIQVTCSSSYFHKFYVSHKDVALPQVWPRPHDVSLNPPHSRHRLVYFTGRIQNSRVRQELIALWETIPQWMFLTRVHRILMRKASGGANIVFMLKVMK